jgi:hypothetical protein
MKDVGIMRFNFADKTQPINTCVSMARSLPQFNVGEED